jgi:hypothetical protein
MGAQTSERLRTRPLYRWEYEAPGEQGFFADEQVELVLAAEEGSHHAAVHRRLARALFDAIPAEEGEIGVGNPALAVDVAAVMRRCSGGGVRYRDGAAGRPWRSQ